MDEFEIPKVDYSLRGPDLRRILHVPKASRSKNEPVTEPKCSFLRVFSVCGNGNTYVAVV